MTHEAFEAYHPKPATMRTIMTANEIIRDFGAQDLTLTLRQLYYQFVKRNLITNTNKSYKRLGNILSRARLGGMLDWAAIEDRLRRPVIWREFLSVEDMLEQALNSYRLRRLQDQDAYVELWVEKDALAGVLEPVASRYHVTLMVNRGYSSSSAMKAAGDRIRRCCTKYGSKRAVVFYLGDLDPSGEDMVRDIRGRVGSFLNDGWIVHSSAAGVTMESATDRRRRKPFIELDVIKLALTMEQVEEYDPPPNPTKLTDSRARGFIEKFGRSSWEVDALSPATLQTLISDAFESVLNMDLMDEIREDEQEHRARLRKAIAQMQDAT